MARIALELTALRLLLIMTRIYCALSTASEDIRWKYEHIRR